MLLTSSIEHSNGGGFPDQTRSRGQSMVYGKAVVETLDTKQPWAIARSGRGGSNAIFRVTLRTGQRSM
jgi:hypothetical protein